MRRRLRDRIAAEFDVEKERIFKSMESNLKTILFGNVNQRAKFTSCPICFDEFTIDTAVRETPCQHIFHN